ncbi:MAG: plastocyanin/azurin family copper-binding protein [Deltaproteobacteria bacterium]
MHFKAAYFKTAIVLVIAVLIYSSLVPARTVEPESREHVVEISNLRFIPKEIVVAPGDTIIWVNRDFVPHTVTANDESWDSGLIEAEGRWETVIKADMQEGYFCRYHPSMTAKLFIIRRQ